MAEHGPREPNRADLFMERLIGAIPFLVFLVIISTIVAIAVKVTR